MQYTAFQRTLPPQLELFQLYKEEPGGGRPAPLPEVAGRRTGSSAVFVEQIIENFVPVQILDVPVASAVSAGVQDRILQSRPW